MKRPKLILNLGCLGLASYLAYRAVRFRSDPFELIAATRFGTAWAELTESSGTLSLVLVRGIDDISEGDKYGEFRWKTSTWSGAKGGGLVYYPIGDFLWRTDGMDLVVVAVERGRVVPWGHDPAQTVWLGPPLPTYFLTSVDEGRASAMFAIPPALTLIRHAVRVGVRRTRVRQGRCPACGYDLRQSPGNCPECNSARQD